ncbi:MAG TPA: aldo/keto reductase [Chthoniobacterales bacterium]|nr:aldo/keto reductase [Chthoniobacterales bacterium]
MKLIGATTASVCLPIGSSRIFAAEGSPLRRAIPSTGEKLPVIGLGSAVTFDVPFNSPKVTDITEVITRFVNRGGKVIDSSPSYGNAESLIGQIAGKSGLTDSLFIATKVRARGREAGIAQIEQSLGRFQTRKIDLIQVHNLVDVDAQMSALRESKSKGKIRYTGITYSEPQGFAEIERNMKSQRPDFVQINYSIVDRGAAQRILPLAQELRMGVIINRPFGSGGVIRAVLGKPLPPWAADFDCHSWAQFLLKWVVSHPAVTCVIPATNNPQHLEDNMGAGFGRLPDAKTRQRMAALFT